MNTYNVKCTEAYDGKKFYGNNSESVCEKYENIRRDILKKNILGKAIIIFTRDRESDFYVYYLNHDEETIKSLNEWAKLNNYKTTDNGWKDDKFITFDDTKEKEWIHIASIDNGWRYCFGLSPEAVIENATKFLNKINNIKIDKLDNIRSNNDGLKFSDKPYEFFYNEN